MAEIKEMSIPSINTLHSEKLDKETSKMEIFNVVLSKCVEKIIYTNRHTDMTYIIFEVPKLLIGYPGYDLKSCILFLIHKLSRHGYIVEFIEPFYLYIDWGSPDYSKRQTKLSSIVPAKNPDKLRQQTKAILQQFPNVSKVEYVYEDQLPSSSSKQVKKIKKKKK